MSFICFLTQHVFDTRLHAVRRVFLYAEFLCNRVRRYESNAVNIIGEAIGVFGDDGNCIIFIGFVNLGGVRRADIVRLQKEHHIFNLALGRPSLLNHLHALLADTGDTRQFFRCLFNHIHRIHAELVDNPRRHFRADTLNEPRTEVFSQPDDVSRQNSLVTLNLELSAVSVTVYPSALQKQAFPGVHRD